MALKSVQDHSSDVKAGVGVYDLARDGRCVVACKKHGNAADLAGIDRAPKRGFGSGLGDQPIEVVDARRGSMPCRSPASTSPDTVR